MYDHLPVIEINRVLKQTYVVAGVLGGLALVVSGVLGNVLVGLGVILGLALGAFNGRMARGSIASFAAKGEQRKRQSFVFSSLGRLALVTAIAFVLVVVTGAFGWGVLGGLAVFQLTMLANASRLMLRSLRQGQA